MSKSIGVICPFCGTRMWVHGVHSDTPMLKHMTATCKNAKCLSSVSVYLVINHVIRPSLIETAPEIAPQQVEFNY